LLNLSIFNGPEEGAVPGWEDREEGVTDNTPLSEGGAIIFEGLRFK